MREVDAVPELDEGDVGRIFREEYGRCVATLIRVFGDIDVAEDAVQEAFAIALRKWPGDGPPPNPGGWITTTARNRAIDTLRREARGRELLNDAALRSPDDEHPGKLRWLTYQAYGGLWRRVLHSEDFRRPTP